MSFKVHDIAACRQVAEVDDLLVTHRLNDFLEVQYAAGLPSHVWLSLRVAANILAATRADDPVHVFLHTLAEWLKQQEGTQDKQAGRFFGFTKTHASSDYQVRGTISRAGTPLTGVRVMLFDKDIFSDDTLGLDFTGADGGYQVRFNEKDFKTSFSLEGEPDIYMVIEALDTDAGEFKQVERLKLKKTSQHSITHDVVL